ncbi:hypothetical protein FRC06_006869 [Ceratobasidium sp. 370]|nr:hypothetical protein FRC06_006869 [Ceratobasidium sp. 370]
MVHSLVMGLRVYHSGCPNPFQPEAQSHLSLTLNRDTPVPTTLKKLLPLFDHAILEIAVQLAGQSRPAAQFPSSDFFISSSRLGCSFTVRGPSCPRTTLALLAPIWNMERNDERYSMRVCRRGCQPPRQAIVRLEKLSAAPGRNLHLVESAWLPFLAKGSARLSVFLPGEANFVRGNRGDAADANQDDLDSGPILLPQQNSVALRPLKLVDGPNVTRRFLTFLPHSGFNNQRIALENAMLLAYILNCTLVAPPVRLGEPLPYRPFDTLKKWNNLASRPKPRHCVQFPHLVECASYNSFVQMPWSQLVDFRSILDELGLDIIFVDGSQTPYQFLREIGIPNESIAFLKDNEPYQYRIHDSPDGHEHGPSGPRYQDEWHLDYLDKVLGSATVVHFGSLFGTGRLKIHSSAYAVARSKIHNKMIISHPGVLDAANAIRKKIAGPAPGNSLYLAVHVRVGGRKFRGSAKENGRLIWWELVTWLGVPQKSAAELERQFLRVRKKYAGPPAPPDLSFFKNSTRSFLSNGKNPHIAPSGKLSCPSPSPHTRSGPKVSDLGVPLFIATDAPNPRAHSSLALFYATFSCVFVLSDFRQELDSLNVFQDADGLPIGDFLVPLVDAVVAGQATHVIGTRNRSVELFMALEEATSSPAAFAEPPAILSVSEGTETAGKWPASCDQVVDDENVAAWSNGTLLHVK